MPLAKGSALISRLVLRTSLKAVEQASACSGLQPAAFRFSANRCAYVPMAGKSQPIRIGHAGSLPDNPSVSYGTVSSAPRPLADSWGYLATGAS